MKNFIPWTKSTKKLLKLQKKIQWAQDQPRLCRNLQRLLRRTSWIQLYAIRQTLLHLETQEQIMLHSRLVQLTSPQYRFSIKLQITDQLWIFALSPLVFLDPPKAFPIVFLTGKKSQKIYQTVLQFFKISSVHYIMIHQIQNFFSQQNKFWILSNISIEKKYFLTWLKSISSTDQKTASTVSDSFEDQNNRQDLDSLIDKNLTDLKTIFQYFSIQHFLNSAVKNNFFQKNLLIEYHYFLLSFIKEPSFFDKRESFLKNCFSQMINTTGLSLKFLKIYSRYQGFHFLGWHFSSHKNYFLTSISQTNIRSHQKEFKKYLKNSLNPPQPVDQVINQLNRKIRAWKKFYYLARGESKTRTIAFESKNPTYFEKRKLNNYLFWRIWYWIKKRHRTKNSIWLYKKYWKKSTSKKWIFSTNYVSLISY